MGWYFANTIELDRIKIYHSSSIFVKYSLCLKILRLIFWDGGSIWYVRMRKESNWHYMSLRKLRTSTCQLLNKSVKHFLHHSVHVPCSRLDGENIALAFVSDMKLQCIITFQRWSNFRYFVTAQSVLLFPNLGCSLAFSHRVKRSISSNTQLLRYVSMSKV